jgi:hypothetical protein
MSPLDASRFAEAFQFHSGIRLITAHGTHPSVGSDVCMTMREPGDLIAGIRCPLALLCISNGAMLRRTIAAQTLCPNHLPRKKAKPLAAR